MLRIKKSKLFLGLG